MDAVFQRVPADEIYAVTGIQFLPFNTLFQLYAHAVADTEAAHAAHAFLTIPDLLNYWLTGELHRRSSRMRRPRSSSTRTRARGHRACSRSSDLPVRVSCLA